MSEAAGEQPLDAGTASDEEVAAALGIGDDAEDEATDESQGENTGDETEDEGQEPSTLEDLPAWAQDEIKRLRREAASQRVKAREQARKAPAKAPTPKDLTAAEQRGRDAARLEYGVRLAGAEVKASLAGVVPDDKIDEIVEDLNLARYVQDDGEPDTEAIKQLREKYVTLLGTRKTPKVGHGRSGSAPSNKTTADQFADAVGGFFN